MHGLFAIAADCDGQFVFLLWLRRFNYEIKISIQQLVICSVNGIGSPCGQVSPG